MDATRFEFNVSVPCNAGGAVMVRKLAEQAARYAGCARAGAAEGFAAAVEEAVHAHVNGSVSAEALMIVFRRSVGPIEVLVGHHTIALDL